jgi:hypothetical protein
MEEPLPVAEPPPDAPKHPATSLAARLLNVFAMPREVFEEVRTAPVSIANWLVPAVLWALVGAVAALALLAQPEIQQRIRENQTKAFEKQVQAGKMTKAEVAQIQNTFEKLSVPVLVVLVLFLSFVRLVWWASILWLFGLIFLKARFPYLKSLEVAGLAVMISVLGVIVALLLSLDVGQVFSAHGFKLTLADFALVRRSRLVGGAADVFSIWMLGVMSVGLSRLARVPFLRAAWLIFAYWLLQQSFFLLLGFGQLAF